MSSAAPTRTATPLRLDPLLLTARECGHLIGCGRQGWFYLVNEGKAPAPIELSEDVDRAFKWRRWRFAEIVDWVLAGCPEAADWRWVPTTTISLTEYRDLLLRQIVSLQDEAKSVEARIERGERLLHVRPEAHAKSRAVTSGNISAGKP